MKQNALLDLTAEELVMFREVAKVINKHKKSTRNFGLQLIHSHFPLKKGEMLHETNDKEKRVMTIKPVSVNEIPSAAFATGWTLSKNGKPKVSMMCCDTGGVG